MRTALALVLITAGVVAIRSSFAPNPDPRAVFAAILSGQPVPRKRDGFAKSGPTDPRELVRRTGDRGAGGFGKSGPTDPRDLVNRTPR